MPRFWRFGTPMRKSSPLFQSQASFSLWKKWQVFPAKQMKGWESLLCDDTRFVSGLMIILMFGTRIYYFLYFYLKAHGFNSCQSYLMLENIMLKIYPIFFDIWPKSFCCKYWLIITCWKVVGRVVMVIAYLYICLKPSCCLWFWVLYHDYHYPSGGLPRFFVLLNNLKDQ